MKLISHIRDDSDILENWLKHYQKLGVTSFHVIVHGSREENHTLYELMGSYPIVIEDSYTGEFRAERKAFRLNQLLERMRGQWLCLVDSDEFVELPYSELSKTVSVLRTLGANALYAPLLQRLTKDGSIPSGKGHDPFLQFPYCSPNLYAKLGVAATLHKYPLFWCGNKTRLTEGGNHCSPNRSLLRLCILRGVSHHFKFRRESMNKILERANSGHRSRHESRGFLEYLQKHDWVLPLEDSFPYSRAELIKRSFIRPLTTRNFLSSFTDKLVSGMSYLRATKKSVLWLSLGENCLPDGIIERYKRKSFSTPYSAGRSNIDYALQLEREDYRNLLRKENLCYGEASGTRVVRSTYLKTIDDIYDESCSSGFEFTHHNPLDSESDLDSCHRKIERLRRIRGNQDVLFLYYHRQTKNSDFPRLIKKLCAFGDFYLSERATCFMVLFHQIVVDQREERRLEIGFNDHRFLEFRFFVNHSWSGSDPRMFWAKIDDDLIGEMVSRIDEHFKFRRR